MTNFKKLTLVASAVAGLALASAAMADGYYVGASIGYGKAPRVGGTAGTTAFDTEYKGGFVGNVEGGMKEGQVRYGLEYSYNSNKVKNYSQANADLAGATGNSMAQAVLGNVYYDFDNIAPVTPYVGLGLGYINVMKNAYASNATAAYGARFGTMGYQGIVGAAYNLAGNVAVTVDYRYLASLKKDTDVFNVPTTLVRLGSDKIRFQNNQFNLGLVYKFC